MAETTQPQSEHNLPEGRSGLSRSETLAGNFSSPALTTLRTTLAILLTIASLSWSSDLFRTVGLNILDEQIVGPMLGVGFLLVYIIFPIRRGTVRTFVPWYDWIAGLSGLAAGWYIGFTFDTLVERMLESPPDAIITGGVVFVLALEGLRRTTGYALFGIVLLFSIYALVGHLVPGDLETRKVDVVRLVIYSSLDTSALMGFVLKVALSIVVTFVFFGQILMKAGGGQFFNDIALALMGRYRGGSAKISITASSLFGSVSGIVVSNIVATGIVTIPLMKKNGFPARLAAAVEAAGNGGDGVHHGRFPVDGLPGHRHRGAGSFAALLRRAVYSGRFGSRPARHRPRRGEPNPQDRQGTDQRLALPAALYGIDLHAVCAQLAGPTFRPCRRADGDCIRRLHWIW
jgi:uncharacterized membrane protein (GlpM family)